MDGPGAALVSFAEDAISDDNPNIRHYLGSGDLRIAYAHGGHVLAGLVRYGGGARGSLQLDWTFPVLGSLAGYVQFFTGYGETLVDYNHSQTTIGAGILFFQAD